VDPLDIERDDGLEDPYACTDPYTGETVNRGTAILVPYGTPMPPGSTPPYQDGSHLPSTSLYVCQDGRWVGVVSYLESSIQLVSDAPSVTAVEGSAVVMTGSCTYAGEAGVTLSASAGSVEVDGDGGWTWQLTADDGPAGGQIVVVTATADDRTAKVAFELIHP
jgi:hypothetical protein